MNIEELSAVDAVRLAATQVMGWKIDPYTGRNGFTFFDTGEEDRLSYHETRECTFNPLRSDADALSLIDAIDPTDFSLEKSGGNWTADFGGPWSFTHVDRRRAIVVAALRFTEARA